MPNKDTKTVYDFYTSKLADPKSLKNKNVCLIATGNARYISECKKHAKSTFVLESRECRPFDGIDFKNIDSLKETIENWLKARKMKKFDLIVMNPPYDRSLHLKILESVIPYAEKVVNISPIRWLQDPLAKYKGTLERHSTILSKLADLQIVPMQTAEQMMNASFNFDLGIYTIKSTASPFDSNRFNNAILDKVIAKMPDNVDAHMIFAEPKRHSLVLSNITGGNQGRTSMLNYWCNDFDRYSYNDGLNSSGQTYHEYRKSVCWGNVKPRPECSHIEFENENELVNFYDSINTRFFLYLFNAHSVDVHVNAKFLPYMCDYSQPWTDKRFCDYFKITGYIDDNTAVPGSEWETILNSATKK